MFHEDIESKQKGTVAAIEKQIRESMERKQVTITKKNKPQKFRTDFSILDKLEEDDG